MPRLLKARPQQLLSTSFLIDVSLTSVFPLRFRTHYLFTFVFVYLFIHLFVGYLETRPVADPVYSSVLGLSVNNVCTAFTAGIMTVPVG